MCVGVVEDINKLYRVLICPHYSVAGLADASAVLFIKNVLFRMDLPLDKV